MVPNGDLATILDRAVTALLAQVERAKFAATDAPRARGGEVTLGSRHIPAAVRRAVWTRDEGRCAFVGAAGRCTERGFLEFHHVVPYAAGGEATVDTIELRCRAHNHYEAALDFGLRVSPRTTRVACTKARSLTRYGHSAPRSAILPLVHGDIDAVSSVQLGPDRVTSRKRHRPQ